MSNFRKHMPLPSVPKTSSGVSSKDVQNRGRDRAMTSSSYASTAIPPKLEADLNFGGSGFDDMFSELNRKESPPDMSREAAGRSLLSEKRTFQAEPIKIRPQLDIEAPLKSWDSRGSAENLMSSPHSDDDDVAPPPPPPHKYSSYEPVASGSPTLPSSSAFQDTDAQIVRQSLMGKNHHHESLPEQAQTSLASSPAHVMQTPTSSRSSNTTNNTTPKAALASTAYLYNDDEEDNMFAVAKSQSKPSPAPVQKPVAGASTSSAATASSSGPKGRVLTQAEYRAMQNRQKSQPPPDDDSEEEDYEDEEEAIKKRQDEEIVRRKQQQMHFAREAMRRTITAPPDMVYPDGSGDGMGMSFPSETSMKADEWEDEDVPLGILAQHGFPSQARSRVPSQPANAMPSYFPDRPASAGALGSMPAHMPAFARNLPTDPHTSYIGGGLVRPSQRESLGFNGYGRGSASIAGDSVAGGMGMSSPMMYQDAGLSQPSLVDQIQMRDMSKKKYMGGASTKKPEGGPFTGMLGQQMNSNAQDRNSTRMSQMPMLGMNPMMGGQMPMGMGMGMNPMGYGMPPQNDYMQMQQWQHMQQQMFAMHQMQMQQMQMGQQPQQDPRMSMAMPNSSFGGNMMGNGSFLNVPGSTPQNRPMSFMSMNGAQQQPAPMQNYLGSGAGYTPSIAPSERSNIGLSARYRPVVNNSDAHSTGTSMTLQASGGGTQTKPGVIKGILKKTPRITVEENDEDWSRLAARKSKYLNGNKPQSNGLEELTKGLNI
jgi:hypothetical protein